MHTLCSIMEWHFTFDPRLGQATCCKLADYIWLHAAINLEQLQICHYVSCSFWTTIIIGYLKGANEVN